MNGRAQVWLWLAQRVSGAVLAVSVAVHLITMVTAVQGGLSAAEIGARLSGSLTWLGFYLLFVIACAVHAPIGIRNVLSEWTPMAGAARDVLCVAIALILLWLGARAAFAMYAS